MTQIKITPDDVMKARGATFLTGMDTVYSPRDGSMIPVAMHHGVHVCWQCGEPFEPAVRGREMVEKVPDMGATVRVGVHAKCVSGKVQSFWSVAQGLGVRRKIAEIAQKSASLVAAAAEGAKKIVA